MRHLRQLPGRRGGQPTSGADAVYPLQSQVRHEEFGTGTVTDLEEDRVTVLFDDVGYRTLSLDVVAEQGLLERTGD